MTNYEIDILKKALLKIERNELVKFKSLPNENVIFSEEFEENIQKIAKKRTSFGYRATKTIPRRVAVAFFAAVITFCLMMTISAIRVPVVNFFVNVYEEFISIFVDEDEGVNVPETIENIYLPTYMINNYSQTQYQCTKTHVETTWSCENEEIVLSQNILKENFKSYIDNQELDYVEANFDSLDVYYMSKNDQYFVLWSKDNYLFSIICSNGIELSEIEKIIKSLSISTD